MLGKSSRLVVLLQMVVMSSPLVAGPGAEQECFSQAEANGKQAMAYAAAPLTTMWRETVGDTESAASNMKTGNHFPGATWEFRTPAEVGLEAEKLDQFAASVQGAGCIAKDGYMIKTWGSQDTKFDWASAMKPVMTTMLFFAVYEGRLQGVDDPVRPYVQSVFGKDLIPKDMTMTFRHLANMVSGYALPDAPGEAWAYSDYGITLYSRLLFDGVFDQTPNAAATDADRLGYLQFQDGSLFSSRDGRGVYTTPRDFARIGWFWLNKGKWKERQLLPSSFFDAYCRPDVPGSLPRSASYSVNDYLDVGSMAAGGTTNDDRYLGQGFYGFNWWFNDLVGTSGNLTWPDAPMDTFQANGHGNVEIVTVIPSLNMVVAAKGNWGTFVPGDPTSGMNQNLRLLAELDSDGDGIGNYADPDDDNDGYWDEDELTENQSDPLDPTSTPSDNDGDFVSDLNDPDDDDDGMPDMWEEKYGLDPFVDDAHGDVDCDGQLNCAEHVAGTDPTDRNSRFAVKEILSALGQPGHLITVSTEPGRKYTIYYADSLSLAGLQWSSFANTEVGVGTWIETSGSSSTYTFVDDEGPETSGGASAAGYRFYRVQVELP